jgi:hypothetical protein
MQIKSMTALALTAAFMAFGSAPASANASTDPVTTSRHEAEPVSARCTCGVRYYRVYRIPRVYYRVYRVRYYYI